MSVISIPSSTANSYASNAEAIAVWSIDPHKTDYPTVETSQDQALRTATQQLDDTYGDKYKGELYDATFALYQPRTGVTDPRTGVIITDYTVYQDDIKRATAIQAYYVFKNDRDAESADLVSTNTSEKLEGVGSVSRGTTSEQIQATNRSLIHDEAARIMTKWVDGITSKYSTVIERG